jgi:hypothetical protein
MFKCVGLRDKTLSNLLTYYTTLYYPREDESIKASPEDFIRI